MVQRTTLKEIAHIYTQQCLKFIEATLTVLLTSKTHISTTDIILCFHIHIYIVDNILSIMLIPFQ